MKRLLLLLAFFGILSCGGGDSDDSSSGSRGALNGIVPGQLAVSSPTEDRGGLGLTFFDKVFSLIQEKEDASDYNSKVDRIDSVLKAEDLSSCLDAMPNEFSLAQGIFGHHQCASAAEVEVSNHPDTNGTYSSGAGDLGLWWDSADPEDGSSQKPCAVGVLNSAMESVAAYSDTAMGMHSMLACVGRLKGVSLPSEVNESVDMISHIAEVDTASKSFTVSSASITRQADSSDGYQVYQSAISGTLEDVPRNIETAYELRVRHAAENEDNTVYSGVIQFEMSKLEDDSPGVISIAYKSDGESIHYRYRQGLANAGDSDFDESNYEVAFSADSNPKQVIADIDSEGYGKLTLSWSTAGNKTFNVETKSDKTGVAYFGYAAEDSAGEDAFDDIIGFKCFPQSETYSDYVQKQTFELKDSGSWELKSGGSKILYAPTKSCDWNTSNDASQSASFTITNQDLPDVTEVFSFPVENQLGTLSDYQSDWQDLDAPTLSF